MVTGGGHRVLIADDDRDMTRVLGAELSRAGYQVEVCGDGLEAVARVLSWRPHLVLLDHSMPGLDGRAVCSRLRRSQVKVRIVMLTGSHEVDDRVAGLDAGADDYVCKPFELAELAARLRAQLREIPTLGEAAEPGGLDLRVLGRFEMHWRGAEVSDLLWNRRQPLVLLKLLLCHYGRPLPFEVVQEALWPDTDAARSRASLHVAVQRLRQGLRSLGPERVLTTAGGYVFRLQPEDRLDLQQLDGAEDPATVVRLYRGELFSEEPYADWVRGPRERVHRRVVDLLRRAGSRDALQALVDLEPTEEAHAVALASRLLDEGEGAAAGAVLDRLRRALADLELAPGPGWERLREWV